MHKILQNKFFGVFLIFTFFLLVPIKNFGQIIGWDANNTGGGFGNSPWTASTLNSNLLTSGLVRGSSIATGGSPAGNCWGGSGGWSTAQNDANSFYFTFQAKTGYKVSLSTISTATRRSNSGPTGCAVWYSVGGAAFVRVADWTTTSSSGTTGTPNSVSLSGIAALQNVASGVVIKIRIIPQGSTGNYYLTGGTNSLKIDGSVVVAANPLLTPSTTSLASFGDVMVGHSSASSSFTFDGSALTEDVSIAAPAGFEISTDNINWYPGTDISPISGALNDIQIWVRFSPTAVGNASGNIVLSSTGAVNKLVSVSGNGIPAVSSIFVDDEPYGPYCNGIANTFDLDFTPSGGFIGTNFYAQLSNPDGSFPTTATNIVGVSAESPISVTFPANTPAGQNYRVRVYNEDPFTFSSNDNGHDIVINSAATLSGITQANTACGGSQVTLNMSGLLPNSTSTINYNINGGASQVITGITADASGNASFPIVLLEENNNQTLTVATIERTDISSCPHTLTANNFVVLAVNPSPTMATISSTSVCGTSGNTIFSLTGLIANSTSDISYSIAGGTAVTVNGIAANAAGEATFEIALLPENNGQTLAINSITRTDVTPNCRTQIPAINTILVINPKPTAAISGDQTICLGSVSSDISIVLTGTAPWNITYTDGTNSFDIDTVLLSPYILNVTTTDTKTYTIIAVEDANCTATASEITGSATVNVNPISSGGTVTGSTSVCSATNNGTLTLTGHVGNIVKWQSSPTLDFSGTISDIANTTATLEYTNLAATTYYRAVVSNIPCPEANSDVATIVVNITPAPTTNPQSFCTAGTVADLLPNTAGIRWYSSNNGGTELLATEPLANGNYYATMTIDGCESARTETAVTLNITPAPTTSPQSFCTVGTVADLLPNTTGIKWYSSNNSGTELLPTEPLANGNYYATMTIAGCESARTETAVTINITPAPTTIPQSFCTAGTVADLLPNTTGIRWYASSNAGTELLPTQSLANGNYYATMTIDGCESARTETAVTINITPAPTTSQQNFCTAGTVADLLPNTAGIRWYSSNNGGTELLPTQSLANGNYYATMTIAGCESAKTETTVTITTVSIPSGQANQDFIEGETLADLEIIGTDLEWYPSIEASEQGTAPLDSTNLLVDEATYYVIQTNGDCRSIPLAVTVSKVLGTPDFNFENIKLYPNPVTAILTISNSENIDSLEVFNLLGQKVMEKTTGENNFKVDMSELLSGTYLVKIISGKASKTFKIIKR